jgi:hypothetical protein
MQVVKKIHTQILPLDSDRPQQFGNSSSLYVEVNKHTFFVLDFVSGEKLGSFSQFGISQLSLWNLGSRYAEVTSERFNKEDPLETPSKAAADSPFIFVGV